MKCECEACRFQSLIGRLKTYTPYAKDNSKNKFQSLIGRLKTGDGHAYNAFIDEFQSLIGRLKTAKWYTILSDFH